MGCWKVYRLRMEKEPSLEAREHRHRKLGTERLEDLYLSLQPGINKGDAKAIEAGVRVLALKAKVLGYAAPEKVELTGSAGAPIPLALVRERDEILLLLLWRQYARVASVALVPPKDTCWR
jgi:hypothetical protein